MLLPVLPLAVLLLGSLAACTSGVGTYPYQLIGTVALLTLGGTRAGDVKGQSTSWSKVLALLAAPSG